MTIKYPVIVYPNLMREKTMIAAPNSLVRVRAIVVGGVVGALPGGSLGLFLHVHFGEFLHNRLLILLHGMETGQHVVVVTMHIDRPGRALACTVRIKLAAVAGVVGILDGRRPLCAILAKLVVLGFLGVVDFSFFGLFGDAVLKRHQSASFLVGSNDLMLKTGWFSHLSLLKSEL